MAARCLGHAPTRAETLFNNANLLRIRPAPTATGIGDREDLDFGSVSMVGHNVGPKWKHSAPKDGPRRRFTILDLRLLLDPDPEASDFLDGLARHIAGEQSGAALRDEQPPLAHDGRHIPGDRHTVHAA